MKPERLPAATALYGAITDLGFIVGPALAALLLLFGGPEVILYGNAATFALSAVVLTQLRFGAAPPVEDASSAHGPASFAKPGRVWRRSPGWSGIRAVIVASGAMLLFAGIFNVAELPFATDELDARRRRLRRRLTAIYGLGFVAGSLSGSRGGETAALKRRFLGGLALVGVGFIACGLAPGFAAAAARLRPGRHRQRTDPRLRAAADPDDCRMTA